MKELNTHFADSLILFCNLMKEKHAGFKQDDGSFVKINQEALYKHLFGADFRGHDALEDVKALSGTTDINSAIADMNYLDRSHALLKSFDGIIGGSSEGGVMTKPQPKSSPILDSVFTTLKACSANKENKDFLQC